MDAEGSRDEVQRDAAHHVEIVALRDGRVLHLAVEHVPARRLVPVRDSAPSWATSAEQPSRHRNRPPPSSYHERVVGERGQYGDLGEARSDRVRRSRNRVSSPAEFASSGGHQRPKQSMPRP
ncbi:hypothetical protein PR202_gb18560 [Eleusine coracana subsp. coracana]|uniref:Uncharacterized protein n=1 Tax=Eleusine coracana subsp. coracana TaxID=191504 RepID=A0AAV5F3K7_ELECO|nr:hypothetical protein PR202_gb18560 [Eleusine coracana subsp. coracana]